MDLDALLTEANLMRLRGQHAEAERIVSQLLQERPHHTDGNVLMGDLALEQGRSDEAVLWYGNAVDHGAGANAQRKLMELRRSMEVDQARQMEARVASPAGWLAALPWVVLLAFALLGLAAILAMRPAAIRASIPQAVTVPVTVPGAKLENRVAESNPREVEKIVEVPVIGITREEVLIRQALEGDAMLKSALRGVVYDAPSGLATITLEAPEGDPLAARRMLAEAVMTRLPDVKRATIRLHRGSAVVAQTTLERSAEGSLAESGQNPPSADASSGQSVSE